MVGGGILERKIISARYSFIWKLYKIIVGFRFKTWISSCYDIRTLQNRIFSDVSYYRNGTEGNHAEDREMECCHRVLVGGDQFGGIHKTHPYIAGEFKKIGVCDGRSLYQNINNTEIFMYYVCGRWFIGLEVRRWQRIIRDSWQTFRLEYVEVGCSPKPLISVSTVFMKDTGTLYLNWDFRRIDPSEWGELISYWLNLII